MLLQFLRYSSILLFVVNKPKISTITVFKYYNHELSNIIQTIVNQKVKKKKPKIVLRHRSMRTHNSRLL